MVLPVNVITGSIGGFYVKLLGFMFSVIRLRLSGIVSYFIKIRKQVNRIKQTGRLKPSNSFSDDLFITTSGAADISFSKWFFASKTKTIGRRQALRHPTPSTHPPSPSHHAPAQFARHALRKPALPPRCRVRVPPRLPRRSARLSCVCATRR